MRKWFKDVTTIEELRKRYMVAMNTEDCLNLLVSGLHLRKSVGVGTMGNTNATTK